MIMTITKEVVFVAKKESIEALKALLVMMVAPSQAEEGCLFYHICQYKEQPEKFLVVESWRDEVALEGHKASAHYKAYKSSFEPFCAEKYSNELHVL